LVSCHWRRARKIKALAGCVGLSVGSYLRSQFLVDDRRHLEN
jgi:hypothetical protein